jgi:hypothetical protein
MNFQHLKANGHESDSVGKLGSLYGVELYSMGKTHSSCWPRPHAAGANVGGKSNNDNTINKDYLLEQEQLKTVILITIARSTSISISYRKSNIQ